GRLTPGAAPVRGPCVPRARPDGGTAPAPRRGGGARVAPAPPRRPGPRRARPAQAYSLVPGGTGDRQADGGPAEPGRADPEPRRDVRVRALRRGRWRQGPCGPVRA